MICPNCGSSNNNDSKFCITCGQNLVNVQTIVEHPLKSTEASFQDTSTQYVNKTSIQSEGNFYVNDIPIQSTNINNVATQISLIDYFFIILAVILKPFTSFKEEINKFNSFKNSIIISLIVSGISTLVNLIMSMLNAVMVKSYNFSSGGYKTTWVWENLKELDYLQVIIKNFLVYLGIIVVITVVYYIGGLIAKKQTNFSRLLGVSAISATPMLICTLVLSPLLSLVFTELAMPVKLIGVVYTILLLYEGMNREVLLSGNCKYYFNLACLSILAIIAYYLYIKMFTSSISGGLQDIMDLFGGVK